jgi:hypothetical protein
MAGLPFKPRKGSTFERTVAITIEFHVPENFKPTRRFIPADQRGKIIEFPRPGVPLDLGLRDAAGNAGVELLH